MCGQENKQYCSESRSDGEKKQKTGEGPEFLAFTYKKPDTAILILDQV